MPALGIMFYWRVEPLFWQDYLEGLLWQLPFQLMWLNFMVSL